MKLLLLISALAVVNAKPQYLDSNHQSNIQIEKQELIELEPEKKDLKDVERLRIEPKTSADESLEKAVKTKEIYDKIVEINKKHGLVSKGLKTDYDFVEIPTIKRSEGYTQKQLSDFKFGTNPFSNPIFDYLNGEKIDDNSIQIQKSDGFVQSTDNNAKITNEDIIPGQYVKRKVTHQQTLLVPYPMSNPTIQMYAPINNQPEENSTLIQKTLENQTIQNIKSIMNQQSYYPVSLPYQSNPNISPMYSNSYRIFGPNAKIPPERQIQWPFAPYFPVVIKDPLQQMFNAFTSMVEYGPADCKPKNSQSENGLQNIEAQPLKVQSVIKIKDSPQAKIHETNLRIQDTKRKNPVGKFDFVQAKLKQQQEDSPLQRLILAQRRDQSKNDDQNKQPRSFPSLQPQQTIPFDVEHYTKLQQEKKAEIKQPRSFSSFQPQQMIPFDLEDYKPDRQKLHTNIDLSSIQMPAEMINRELYELDQDETKNDRKGKSLQQERKLGYVFNDILLPPLDLDNIQESRQVPLRPNSKLPQLQLQTIPQNQDLYEDEQEEQSKDNIDLDSNNNKKVFSKDNTGSGIFIQRLKVRKGGVAIAGPGGIATAGSGGTAIVGPNGFAYTQPDSLAIAGTGTKVVAVDPSLNLSDVIAQANKNDTKSLEFIERVGRVVAVGPVIYYNRG